MSQDKLFVGERPDRLTQADLAKFHGLGVSTELLVRAHIRRVTDREARDLYGITGSCTKDMGGIVFPYFSAATGARVTARVRRDHPESEDGKEQNKYVSAYGDRKHCYFLSGAAGKLRDPDTAVVLVEAEKSALALTAWAERTATNIVPIAMGGCWGWRGRIGAVENASGNRVDETGPISDLDYVNRKRVYVLLDANVASNAKVQTARNALVRELSTRDSEVFVCNLPIIECVNGPDDYIAVAGDEAMARIFAEAKTHRTTILHCNYGGGRFEVTQRGVVYIGPRDKDGNEKLPLWVCGPLRIIAMTRDQHSNAWGRLLRWPDSDGVQHQWAMPLELLQGDGSNVRSELARQGLWIAPGRLPRELLASYLQVWPIDVRARCVDRIGWHGSRYVLPSEAVGECSEAIVFQNAHAVEPAFSVSGTVDEWRENVAAPAQGNSRLVFALSVTFGGALLQPAGEDSGGFHLQGRSSTGKTAALRAAASVWGNPATYCRVWRSTGNGLEGLAALHNDTTLILDELSQIDPKEAGEAAYLLANGQGKNRATRDGTARAVAGWRLLFLSAGEESLSALMARAGGKPTAGQEIRLAEIEADAGAGMGVLEELHEFDGPAALIEALRDAAGSYYGAVGEQWLRLIVHDRMHLAGVISTGIKAFLEEFVPKGAVGQVERVARRFALVATAGEMATRYGLTGWSRGEAVLAARKCFESWLDAFGAAGSREERALMSQVRAFFESHGASRFEEIHSVDGQRVINRAGFYRRVQGHREYLVLPETFRGEVCKGFDFKYAVRTLKSAGWLIPASDGNAQKPRVPELGTTRVYVLGAAMWSYE